MNRETYECLSNVQGALGLFTSVDKSAGNFDLLSKGQELLKSHPAFHP